MSNNYRNNYQYVNHLKVCPNCGGELRQDNYDCPFCGVNLVGHNEANNMADNMENYADAMRAIANQNDRLNEKIRKDNEKIKSGTKKKKTLKKAMVYILISIVAVFLISRLIVNIINKSEAMNYDEVVIYFDDFNPDMINIERLDYNCEFQNVTHEAWEEAEVFVEMGYDKQKSLTVLKERYDGERKFEVTKILNKNVASVPDIDIYYGIIDYSGKYSFIAFQDFFEEFDKKISPDEYVLSSYIDDYDNFVEKLDALNIDETEINLYKIGTKIGSEKAEVIIGIVQLSSKALYISEVYVYKTETGDNPVLENLEEYFHIIQGD